MTQPLTPDERAKQVEKYLDKMPWTAFSHGALVSAFQQAVEEAKNETRIAMREENFYTQSLEQSRAQGFSEGEASMREKLRKLIPNNPQFNMYATITYLQLDEAIRSLRTSGEGEK